MYYLPCDNHELLNLISGGQLEKEQIDTLINHQDEDVHCLLAQYQKLTKEQIDRLIKYQDSVKYCLIVHQKLSTEQVSELFNFDTILSTLIIYQKLTKEQIDELIYKKLHYADGYSLDLIMMFQENLSSDQIWYFLNYWHSYINEGAVIYLKKRLPKEIIEKFFDLELNRFIGTDWDTFCLLYL